MKKIAAIALATALAVCISYGCKSQKIQVIENKTIVTNTVPVKAFNDEHYVWEEWIFSTNEVKNIEK